MDIHTTQVPPVYTPAGFYMLRAPVLPAQTFLRLAPPEHHVAEREPETLEEVLRVQQERCYVLLEELMAQPQISLAVAIASPSLLHAWEREHGKPDKKSLKRKQRIYAGLLRYLIRMSTRPTPFGLFSGVAMGSFALETQAHLASPVVERIRTRPDMDWLLSLLHTVEEDPALVMQLRVKLNQTAYLAGERAILPFADTYGQRDSRAISLRATPVVRKVFELTQHFISYTDLQAAMVQAFPQATPAQVDRLLWQLWEHHFLISELHPPLTDAAPAEYILNHLTPLDGIEALQQRLTAILKRMTEMDRAGVAAPLQMVEGLLAEQNTLVSAKQEKMLLQVDTALQLTSPTLQQEVGQVVARAAEFLLRQTPLPQGVTHLQDYRLQFLEKYGVYAEVPLLHLLSPENGLDAPLTYECPPRTYLRQPLVQRTEQPEREQLLLHLVMDALRGGKMEVELTQELQQGLERWTPKLADAPDSLEMYLQLHAQSREALDRGEWMAVIGNNCGSMSGGRTFGRFFDLLGTPCKESLRELARREEALHPDVLFAELSYQPAHARSANVSICPQVHAYEIAVGTTPSVAPEYVLSLQDLVVGMDNRRFYLRSLRHGKRVYVCQNHMLNARLAPNICRFLCEVSHDGMPMLSAFDWGNMTQAPFLPRVVMRTEAGAKVVLMPARWNLQASMITPVGSGSEAVRWFQGVQRWREQWRVPRYVYLTEADNRLLLDLEHPLMVSELHDEVGKANGTRLVTLYELLPDFEHLWLRDEQGAGYFAEIVVPLLRSDALVPGEPREAASQETSAAARERVVTPQERNRFPGDDWVYVKLYAGVQQHEELLAHQLQTIICLLQERKLIDRWFFIRYNDPEPHIRLRFHAKESSAIQPVMMNVLSWSLQLAKGGQIQRYTLDTYERETERYGGPAAIDLLEQVFTVDSTVVSAILAHQYTRRLTLDPLAVATFTLDRFFTAWGCDVQQRLTWTHSASEKYAFSKEFRPERPYYLSLFSPQGSADATLGEQRALLLKLLQPQEAYLGSLGQAVRQLEATGKLWVSERSLLGSLAHMHLNRLLGIDRNRENQIYAFWRHTLDALARRPAR